MRFSLNIFLLWIIFCAAGILPGCSSDSQQQPNKSAKQSAIPLVAARTPKDTAGYVFDIPALINLRVDQINTKLGQPLSNKQESDNEQMHTLRYRRQGYELSINYEVQSRRVVDLFFTPATDTTWQTYSQLLHGANIIRESDLHLARALTEQNGLYGGIEIIPDGARVLDPLGHWVPRDSVP